MHLTLGVIHSEETCDKLYDPGVINQSINISRVLVTVDEVSQFG